MTTAAVQKGSGARVTISPLPSLSAQADALARRTGAWVVVESGGQVLAHGPGERECPPTLARSLVHKTTADLRSGVTWRRGSRPLQGVVDGVSVLAVDLGDGASAWYVDHRGGDLGVPLLAAAVSAEAPPRDPVVDELLHPRHPVRRCTAPPAHLLVVQADLHVGALASRVRSLAAEADARLHVDDDLLVMALAPEMDPQLVATAVRTTVPSAVVGYGAVSADATDWVRAAALARASMEAARDLGRGFGSPDDPDVAATILGREAREAVVGCLARLPVHPLHALRKYDARCSTELVDTLAEWCRRGFEVQATATAMHLHSNTLRYRLRRAEEISRIDLRHPRHRLLLQLLLEGET